MRMRPGKYQTIAQHSTHLSESAMRIFFHETHFIHFIYYGNRPKMPPKLQNLFVHSCVNNFLCGRSFFLESKTFAVQTPRYKWNVVWCFVQYSIRWKKKSILNELIHSMNLIWPKRQQQATDSEYEFFPQKFWFIWTREAFIYQMHTWPHFNIRKIVIEIVNDSQLFRLPKTHCGIFFYRLAWYRCCLAPRASN